jgi:hypothetical protein
MSRRITIISIIAVIIGLLPGLSSTAAGLSVGDVVSQVSQTSYRDYLDNTLYTHLGDDRGFGAQHDLARDNIYSEFERFKLNPSLQSFSYSGSTYYNVVGVHPGTTHPENIYIVGAHFDSVNNPGADDNASGMSGVLEAARVLSNYIFEATMVFIAFDREEQGLVGSSAYAQQHSGDNILGMISLDMIAYNPSSSNQARIYGRNDSSAAIKQGLAEAISLYGNGLSSVDSGRLDASDHAPFENLGFPACLLIEYNVWNNPYYHKSTDSVDTPDYIDYAFATNMVSSTVGFLADSAVLIPEPATLLLLALGSVILRRKHRPNPSEIS